MKIYKSAQKFIRRYNLKKDYTYDDLKLISGKQGCSVYEWNPNSPKDEDYLRRVDCWNIAQTNDGFSCRLSDTKISFIKKTLIEQEKKILLLHENIHVFYGHINQNKPLSVTEEKQTTDTHRTIDIILKYKNFALLSFIVKLLLILSLCFIYLSPKTQINLSDGVYITPSGYHYHRESCQYGEEYMNSFIIDKQTAEEHYLPCDLCNPEK